MKVLVINGTEVKGCTWRMKEAFLAPLREGNGITEFYLPEALTEFCLGCKSCFLKGEADCPHAKWVMPIWQAMLDADLIVFAYPVYALRTTAALKNLLDHLCVHWLVHRPDERMFDKRAAVLTQAIGVFSREAYNDVKTSMNWMGVSSVKCVSCALMNSCFWNELPASKQRELTERSKKLGQSYVNMRPAKMSLSVRLKFFVCKRLHALILKGENTPSLDNRHYIEHGWIKPKAEPRSL